MVNNKENKNDNRGRIIECMSHVKAEGRKIDDSRVEVNHATKEFIDGYVREYKAHHDQMMKSLQDNLDSVTHKNAKLMTQMKDKEEEFRIFKAHTLKMVHESQHRYNEALSQMKSKKSGSKT